MIDNIRFTVIAGASAGRMMYQNRCAGPAPSAAAASTTSTGSLCKPARKMTMEYPENCQTTTPITDQRTTDWFPRKSWCHESRPTEANKLLSAPVGAYMYFQRYPVTTGVITAGANNSTRSTFLLLILAFTPRASSSPTTFWMIVIVNAMIIVFRAAPWSAGSDRISRKFARPTKCLTGLSPSQSVKASTAPCALGTSTTNVYRTSPGTTNHHGAAEGRRARPRRAPIEPGLTGLADARSGAVGRGLFIARSGETVLTRA